MTREEAIEILQEEHDWCQEPSYVIKAIEVAITALRPVSQERVEKAWKGEWKESSGLDYGFWVCSKCGFVSEAFAAPKLYKFCPACDAPMTDEAVQMMIERLEALKDVTAD